MTIWEIQRQTFPFPQRKTTRRMDPYKRELHDVPMLTLAEAESRLLQWLRNAAASLRLAVCR